MSNTTLIRHVINITIIEKWASNSPAVKHAALDLESHVQSFHDTLNNALPKQSTVTIYLWV